MSTQYVRPDETLLVLIGPSGAGKTTLVERMVQEALVELTPSWTTRATRNGQEVATDHVFTDEETFSRLEVEGFFLDTAQLFGLPYRYGLPKVTHNHGSAIPVVVLRAMVLPLLHKHYRNVIIYQIEAAKDVVAQRLQARGGSAQDIQKRMLQYQDELLAGRKMANKVFVNDGDFDAMYGQIVAALNGDFASV